ncbi:DUF418 domain-containing protein [Nocardiopsis algeriensis]|uniref:Putative membrane protein YeiB n=1 Tax=Nocardiopsis algeriensis TaxID=1478215 RepID=A0A841IKZ7_9ACTN|nr:DUF418 domain-containing protein [Nocardiopsis algeriensis]MBB6119333.1 putative membrane protein YeiB [Nocardiopsis algeriensis]
MTWRTPHRGPVHTGERALAPDLARGFMLLFIAIANSVWYLWAGDPGLMNVHPAPEGVLDRAAQFFTVMAVDMRSYPMFAFLFGYGMVQLATRQEAAGADVRDVNALLRRRNLWLIVFGFLHALLLWMGDILGAYGVAGLLLGWLFLRRRPATQMVWAWVIVGLMALLTAFGLAGLAFTLAGGDLGAQSSVGGSITSTAANISDPSVLGAALGRISAWPFLSLGQALGLAVPAAVLFGFWAARRRVLEEPGEHLSLLRLTAFLGIATGWLGGLPAALAQIGVWDLAPGQVEMLLMWHMLTGLAGGLGYIALITLVARRLDARGRAHGPVVTAIVATGKRSLSSYLAQSVLCAPVLAAWGLGLGGQLTAWTMFLYAVAVWLVTVAAAYAMERAGVRGPAETLLRRLAYRRGSPGRATAPAAGAEHLREDPGRPSP